MKERPILFSAPMVRAILEGRKTQTRRVIKSPAKNMQDCGMEVIKHRAPGDPWYGSYVWSMRNKTGVWGDYTQEQFLEFCPYGQPGDRLWVRETWQNKQWTEMNLVFPSFTRYAADGGSSGPWRPSIFMPRWASRITLEITGIRVERLQDISESDAFSEGINAKEALDIPASCGGVAVFANIWESINGKGSWDANPWVWVIEFRRIKP